tara:strand:- start:170 stop:382 length:213 start_codon:yes stop_codon:yes gene_type:complete
MTDYTNSMSKFWKDMFLGEEIIDPRDMSAQDRYDFINGIFEDYTYYMKKSSVHALQYGKLLSALIKTYGH